MIAQCLKFAGKCRISIFQFCHFSPFFVLCIEPRIDRYRQIKCLITLFDRCTLFEIFLKCLILILAFSNIFTPLKMTTLVTLFQNEPFFSFLKQPFVHSKCKSCSLCSQITILNETFFCDFQLPWVFLSTPSFHW